jgi:arsenate reductase
LDAVVTVCGNAHETCPYFPPRCKVCHVGFDDPPKLAEALCQKGFGKEKQLDCYRRVRDEIKTFVEGLPDNLKSTEQNEGQADEFDK